MALPSQMERTNETSRPVMGRASRKAKNNTQKLALTIGLAVAGLAIVFAAIRYFPGKGKAADETGDSVKSATPLVGNEAKPTPATTPAPTPKPITTLTTPPVSLTMGSKSGSSSGGMLGNAIDNASKGGANAGDPKPKPVDVTRDPSLPAPTPTPGNLAGTPRPADQGPSLGTDGTTLPATGSTGAVRSLIDAGDRAATSGKPVEARVSFSRALLNPEISKSDAAMVRDRLTKINEDLVFSSKVTPGDPLAETYTVVSGDALVKIVKKRDLLSDYRLIQRVNGIKDPGSLRIGQKLKLVRGPFHAVVTKSDYRLDLFAGSPDEPEAWVYIRSFPVGLGSDNGTPTGTFVVKKNSKLVNPHWVNPKTGEKFDANDPKNPIGEFWLGWEGQGSSSVYTGFGLHGTIEPSSIGNQKSMGCVRLLDNDIATVWEMLSEQISVVKVVP